MKCVWSQVLIGFVAGILALCVAVVAVSKIATFGEETFLKVVFWLGDLNWIHEYQTLITGTGAIIAAYFSIREIRRQIAASENLVQLQIASAEKLESERREARRLANVAVSPLILSSICQYAEKNASVIDDLLTKVAEGRLRRETSLKQFAAIPSGAAEGLKELVEVLGPKERLSFQNLLVSLQIESSRLSGLQRDHDRGAIILRANLESYLLGQAAIYAQAEALFDFGRTSGLHPPSPVLRTDVARALFLLGLHHISEALVDRYNLSEPRVWKPYKTRSEVNAATPTE